MTDTPQQYSPADDRQLDYLKKLEGWGEEVLEQTQATDDPAGIAARVHLTSAVRLLWTVRALFCNGQRSNPLLMMWPVTTALGDLEQMQRDDEDPSHGRVTSPLTHRLLIERDEEGVYLTFAALVFCKLLNRVEKILGRELHEQWIDELAAELERAPLPDAHSTTTREPPAEVVTPAPTRTVKLKAAEAWLAVVGEIFQSRPAKIYLDLDGEKFISVWDDPKVRTHNTIQGTKIESTPSRYLHIPRLGCPNEGAIAYMEQSEMGSEEWTRRIGRRMISHVEAYATEAGVRIEWLFGSLDSSTAEAREGAS